MSVKKIKTQIYSNSNESQVELVTDLDTDPISINEIRCGQYIACEYDGNWWMACVLNINKDIDEI